MVLDKGGESYGLRSHLLIKVVRQCHTSKSQVNFLKRLFARHLNFNFFFE